MIVYVFLVKRVQDKETWPCVYTDRDLAIAAIGRCSSITAVDILDKSSLPYGVMCRRPKACRDKGYCPLDPTCGD